MVLSIWSNVAYQHMQRMCTCYTLFQALGETLTESSKENVFVVEVLVLGRFDQPTTTRATICIFNLICIINLIFSMISLARATICTFNQIFFIDLISSSTTMSPMTPSILESLVHFIIMQIWMSHTSYKVHCQSILLDHFIAQIYIIIKQTKGYNTEDVICDVIVGELSRKKLDWICKLLLQLMTLSKHQVEANFTIRMSLLL